MERWIDKLRLWTAVRFGDPQERVDHAMVRVLLLGNVALALIGLFDLARLRTAESSVQVVAASLFVILIWWMDHSHRPYPRTLLVMAALPACATLFVAGVNEDYYWLTDPGPMAFLFTTGVLALVLGGRWSEVVAFSWSAMIVVGIVATRWPASHSYGQVASDIATVLVLMALTFAAVVTVERANREGRAQYERLMETAPVGITELDLREVRSWLVDNGYETMEQYRLAADAGEIDLTTMVSKAILQSHNQMASEDIMLVRPSEPTDGLGLDDTRTIADVLARILFEAESGSIELTLDIDGHGFQRVLNWTAFSPDRRSVLIIATDISEQKAAERALADQIRYKDEFIASVSHELRTPLTAVVGLIDEITRPSSPIDTAEREELMGIVAEQSHEVADIVEDLLVAARAASGNLSTSPVGFRLTDTVVPILELYDEPIDCSIEDGLAAYADPARVRQIVRNLVSNAIRYGGADRSLVGFAHGEEVMIEVRDDGPPIPGEQRNLMFEPYERARPIAKTRPESVGLGLTVARSLAETMGGGLSYEHDGRESVFCLTLPRLANASTATASAIGRAPDEM